LNTSVLNLRNQVRRSQKAKAALVEANLRLVVTVARQTVKKNRSEISFQDACQEGIIGLSRAAEKFDPDKGFRFSSYAVWWIRKMIHKNVSEQSRPFHLPANAMKKINDIRIQEKILQDELGRKPRDYEVANKVGITLEKLEFYRRALQDVISLDKKVKFKKSSNDNAKDPDLHEVVVDPSYSPIESLTTQMLKDDVRRLIRTLSPREQAVIRLRFGLDNGTAASVEDVARKFNVERDQVQKIELRALKKLQEPYRNASLKPYIVDF
jgi:RNA polymerase primary sigma factor